MRSFKNKTVLITGASSGIGMAFARQCAKASANLVLAARSKNNMDDLAKELKVKHAITINVIKIDLQEPGSAEKLFSQVRAQKIHVDVLVNNAGFGKWGNFLNFTLKEYNNMLNLNVLTLTELCHLFLPGMLEKRDGGIINIASTAAYVPVPYAAVYSASKSYVLYLTEALNGEYSKSGVTVTALCPGGTASNFASVAHETARMPSSNLESPEAVARNGLRAFQSRMPSAISGKGNQIFGVLPRILPRRYVIKITGRVWRKMLDRLAQ